MKLSPALLGLLSLACSRAPQRAPDVEPIAPWVAVATDEQARACLSPDGTWRCSGLRQPSVRAMASSANTIPASWRTALWVFDPVNLSGNAKETNPCISTAAPCVSLHEIYDIRWGCLGNPAACPRLQQPTIILQMSGVLNDSDVAYLTFAVEHGAPILFLCALPPPSASGTLTSAQSKSRDAGVVSDFADTVGMGDAGVGMLIQDFTVDSGTDGGSRSFCVQKPTATSCWTTQPLATEPTPVTNLTPPESDNATAGDQYAAYDLYHASIAAIRPTVASWPSDAGVPVGCPVTIAQCNVWSASGIATDAVEWGPGVCGADDRFDRTVKLVGDAETHDVVCTNCLFNGGFQGMRPSTGGGYWRVQAGALMPNAGAVYNPTGMGLIFDGDVWVASMLTLPQGGVLSAFHVQALDGGTSTVNAWGNTLFASSIGGYNVVSAWGNAASVLNIAGNGSLKYDTTRGGMTGISNITLTTNNFNSAFSENITTSPPGPFVTTRVAQIGLTNLAIDGTNPGTTTGGYASRVSGYFGGSIMGNLQ